MADTIKTNLGPVTAYADAKAHGYTGTREEFGALLANAGLNLKAAEMAKEGAESAKQAAETAQQAAAENQKNAETYAENAKASADSAAEQANAAKESAAGAANSATAAQESETNAGLSANAAANAEAAAKQAQNSAETAKADAETAKTAAGTSADAAAASAAEAKKTLESIPDDYSTLSGKVDENTSGISELKEDLDNRVELQTTRNLFDGEQTPLPYIVSTSTNLIIRSSTGRESLVMRCDPNTKYCIQYLLDTESIPSTFGYVTDDVITPAKSEFHYLFKNDDGTVYVDNNGVRRRYYLIETPADAKFIFVTIPSTGVASKVMAGIQIELSDYPTEYIPHLITGIYENAKKIEKLESKSQEVLDALVKNSFNYLDSETYEIKQIVNTVNSRQRKCLIRKNHLYIQESFKLYKIDISDEYNLKIESVIPLTDLLTEFRKDYPSGSIFATGICYFNGKIIFGLRHSKADTSADMIDSAVSGAIIQVTEEDFSVVDCLILRNKQVVSSLQLYEDVVVIGLLHHGWKAYKIFDSGFELLYTDDGSGITTKGTEWQFSTCDVDNSRIVFSLYCYGLIVYKVSYDGTTFSAEKSDVLEFASIPKLGNNNEYLHSTFSNCIIGNVVYAVVSANYQYTDTEHNMSGFLSAEIGDMENTYRLYPFDVKPSSETSRQDLAPIFIANYKNYLLVNAGDKGVYVYSIDNNSQISYSGCFSQTEYLAYGVDVFGNRAAISIRDESNTHSGFKVIKIIDHLS